MITTDVEAFGEDGNTVSLSEDCNKVGEVEAMCKGEIIEEIGQGTSDTARISRSFSFENFQYNDSNGNNIGNVMLTNVEDIDKRRDEIEDSRCKDNYECGDDCKMKGIDTEKKECEKRFDVSLNNEVRKSGQILYIAASDINACKFNVLSQGVGFKENEIYESIIHREDKQESEEICKRNTSLPDSESREDIWNLLTNRSISQKDEIPISKNNEEEEGEIEDQVNRLNTNIVNRKK